EIRADGAQIRLQPGVIGASNQLGEFESGLTAHWFGTVPAVVLGGIGTLVVTGAWMKLFPSLAQRDRLH
ncbi:hypothetical protein ACLBVR_31135, partial [Pseudomonas aeruginosa]